LSQIATAQTNATQFTTPFGSQTRQVRLASTLALCVTLDSTAVVTANNASALVPANVPEYFAVTPGQVLNFISTSTSTGYVSLTEMSWIAKLLISRLCRGEQTANQNCGSDAQRKPAHEKSHLSLHC
jgi:hypothetical protein